MRGFLTALLVALTVLTLPAHADDSPIPQRRLVLSNDIDFPGGDIGKIFDTTIDACERACLANPDCHAFTFNLRAGACFPKTGVEQTIPFAGALSGRVIDTPKAVLARAVTRRAELSFLRGRDLDVALKQARGLADRLVTGEWTARQLLDSARAAEKAGNPDAAARYTGAALNLTDAADQWVDYGRLLLAAQYNSKRLSRSEYRSRALSAAINGYLRADGKPVRASALAVMAQALEQLGRGRDMIAPLRLAQSLQPRDDIAALLETAIGKYGFRITGHEVQSDSASPRICADFSEALVSAGVDYAPFVQLPDTGLSVEAEGRQLCVSGVEHGRRYQLTFRKGLPAKSGESLVKPVTLTLYVRDRSPSVRFPGRAYVLPRAGTAALPVKTVNVEHLELSLARVSDRNLIRAIQDDYLGKPMSRYQLRNFGSDMAENVWKGTADVAMEVNRDMTTRLPMEDALKGLPAGVYALTATIPGADPYDTPAATQWFVISDLGLTTMSGVDGLHVFVRSLGTAKADAGVEVQLISRSNRVLGTATTDATGYASFPAGLTRGTGGAAPALIEAKAADDIAFLSLTDPEFDLSDRGVAGHEPAPPIDVFLTTDRGAYRAGETVHATALTRDAEAGAITGLPLTARLSRPDGVEYSRTLAQDAGAGGHVFTLPIAGTAPRGVWRLDILADPDAPPLASQTVLVEDFLPERIDFSLKLPEAPIRLGDRPSLTIAAKYLFGAPGADLSVEGEAQIAAADGLAAFPGYRFGRYDAPFSAVATSLPSGNTTDAAGNLALPVNLPEVQDPARPLKLTVTARVAEGSGRPVERRVTRALTPSTPMIGIKPLFDDVVAENGTARFDVIAVGPQETTVPMTVKWTVNRVVTRYQWYRSYGDWHWEPMTTRTRIATGTAELRADTPLQVSAPVTWGQYEIRVAREGMPYAASSVDFYAGWYAPATGKDTPDQLKVSLYQPDFKPGDTARLRIVPRAAGTALVTVLSNRLIWRQAVEVPAGASEIPIPVTKDWGAGAYVTASLIRPMDAAAGHNPARALGLTYARVNPGPRQLTASIEAPEEAAPRGPLDVAVKVDGVQPGETAYVTLAAVDVGILNLTAFKAPDPSDHYFGQRKLGVGIRDLYGRLIDGMNGAMGQVRSGGDAAAQAKLMSPPPTEKLVAFFVGPVTVGADGLAHATFDLPSFNGTVRLMAVAWSKTGVGQASRDVLVRDPVVVTASLPRFLAPGDGSRLLLEVHHAKGPAGRVGLDVTSTGVQIGTVPSGFDLAEHGQKNLSIPITAEEVGNQTIDVTLTTPGGQRLTKTLNLPVEVNDPSVTRVSRFSLAAGKDFSLTRDVFTGLRPGTGQVTMAVGPIARFDAPGLLETLNRYPYGCTEQLTSKALPLLYFEDVAKVMGLGTRADLRKRIETAVTAVLTNQSSNGAFGLWRPGSGDLWLDAYVTDFLSRARAQGFKVPDVAFRAALDNLRNQINYAPDFDKNGGPYAYALMVLAREGAAAVGDLRYYADVKAGAFDTPIAAAQLGAALAAYGDQTRADAMFRRAARMVEQEPATGGLFQTWRADYGTARRDAAAVLALAGEAGSKVVDDSALIEKIAARPGALNVSTQEATWALLATHALIDRAGAEGFTVDGAPVDGPLIRVAEDRTLQPVTVHNGSQSKAVLTLTTFGVPQQPGKPGGNGYAIKRSYYTLDGKPADIATVKAGTRLVTVLEVTPFGKGEARLMVDDPLPAGFEIDNPHLIRGGDVGALDWLKTEDDVSHSEFRRDRFLAQVDRRGPASFRLAYIVRAVSPGTFHHPAASVEDMYRPAFRAHGATGTVTVQ
ncbi:alpha-2-macroglobulin family protein [Acidimangrovimonas pyrenivorans]|uniref:Alpha-2-macroglobulin family protein n=1 Tax=Acidimangrovimonas pyrenivorans TaxID=2030798 RepID=A0ABV7ACS9_9RHOB